MQHIPSTPSTITIKAWDTTVSVEKPTSEVTISEYIEAVYSCLIGIGFNHDTILEGMNDFAEDRMKIYDVDSDNF